MYRIMIIDDEEPILAALQRMLRRHVDWDVETLADPQEALRRARTTPFDLFLSDYRMPGMDGVTLLKEIKALQPEAMRLILSGYTDLEALMGAINEAEIYRFVCKPWQDYELLVTLKQALEHRDVLVENRHLANEVREQRAELERRKMALEALRRRHPALVEVNWGPDGSIILDERSVS